MNAMARMCIQPASCVYLRYAPVLCYAMLSTCGGLMLTDKEKGIMHC